MNVRFEVFIVVIMKIIVSWDEPLDTLKMEAAFSFETFVNFYQIT
jgi:hypothetical protein